jgi:hypothetical protein
MQGTLGDVRKREADVLYGLVLLFTYGQLFLIVWDMLSMIEGFGTLAAMAGITDPGRIHSFGEMTTMYLGMLGLYIGRNAVRQYQGKDDAEALPRYVFLKIQRGYFYLAMWGTLCFVAYMLKAFEVISRMPYELTITTLGVAGGLFGDKVLKGFLDKRTVRQLDTADAASTAADHGGSIMEYIEKNGRITNNECQQLTGLGDTHSSNLLSQLVQEGKIEQVGEGRYTYYRMKGAKS